MSDLPYILQYRDAIEKGKIEIDGKTVRLVVGEKIRKAIEILASYFDIIFAMNRITHPGEKRLVTYCLQNCPALPDDFENNIKSLTGSSGEKAETVSRMIRLLDEALVRSL